MATQPTRISVGEAASQIKAKFRKAVTTPDLDAQVLQSFSACAHTLDTEDRPFCHPPFRRENVFTLVIPHHVISRDVAFYIGVRRWIPDDMLAAATAEWCPRPPSSAVERLHASRRTLTIDTRSAALHGVLRANTFIDVAVAVTFARASITVFWCRSSLVEDFLPYLKLFPNLREVRTSDVTIPPTILPRLVEHVKNRTVLRLGIPARFVEKGHAVYFPRCARVSSVDDAVPLWGDEATSKRALHGAIRQHLFDNTREHNVRKDAPDLDAFLCGTTPYPIVVDTTTVVRPGKFGSVKMFFSGVDTRTQVRRTSLLSGMATVTVTFTSALDVSHSTL